MRQWPSSSEPVLSTREVKTDRLGNRIQGRPRKRVLKRDKALEQHHIAKHVKIPEPVNGWLRANQNESNVKKAKAPRPNFGETSAKQSLIKEDCVVVCDPPEGFTKDRRESRYTSIFRFVSFFFLFNLV